MARRVVAKVGKGSEQSGVTGARRVVGEAGAPPPSPSPAQGDVDPFGPDGAEEFDVGAAQQVQPSAVKVPASTKVPAGQAVADFLADTAVPWGVVVEDVTSLDVSSTYARLRDELSLGMGGDVVVQRVEVVAALDRADSNSFLALKLARKAKLHEEAEAREVQVQLEVLRSTARKAMEEEKEEGARKKAITIQDVEDYVRAHWPEQSRKLEERHGQARAARAVAEGLRSDWQSRVASLRAILEAVR